VRVRSRSPVPAADVAGTVGWAGARAQRGTSTDPNRMRTPSFEMKVRGAGGHLRLVLSGELDLAAAPALVATLQDLIAGRPEELEIDLRQIRFIDSTGLRTLLVARDDAAGAGIPFYLIPSASEQIGMVFEVTNLKDELPWRHPIDEAQRATIDGLEEAYRTDDRPGRAPLA
jgi:anti-anti-sigma factor